MDMRPFFVGAMEHFANNSAVIKCKICEIIDISQRIGKPERIYYCYGFGSVLCIRAITEVHVCRCFDRNTGGDALLPIFAAEFLLPKIKSPF